jgi:DNA modification methylase
MFTPHMPELTWDSKTPHTPSGASLEIDSIVYPQGVGYPEESPKNHLILGDNLEVMSALLAEYEEGIDLIYADPPFFTNKRYPARVGRGEDSRKPQEWQLVEGYPDSWPDLDAYLDMLYPRLELMHRLLSPTGTFYLHLDWHANAYARVLLDEIFGSDRLINEIIWVYHGPSPIRSAFNRKHDTILAYSKGKTYTFNVDDVRQPYDESTVKTFASSPKAGFGKIPNLERGKVPEDWWYFPVVARMHSERTGYPTQKPEALLDRIIRASSNPGDIVADFFCGAGTSAVTATRLGRRFIANDLTWRAIHTTRTRLVKESSSIFTLQHVGKYPVQYRQHQPGEFELEGDKISLDKDSLSFELDYWEADPAWNGEVFHSATQAVRPRKDKPIANHLTLPTTGGSKPACVRMIEVNGNLHQIVLNK